MNANGTFAGIRQPPKARYFARPQKSAGRRYAEPEVTKEFALDFNEACNVESISPKAAAALARRVLQHVLRVSAHSTKKDLADQIQEVIDSGKLPSHLVTSIDGIRNIGNFAAHPVKNTSTGEIVDVEPGETEWCLDTLEGLFDFYFVQPTLTQKKQAALNAKIGAAGKPAMKGTVGP
jgi:hypothetical protein